MYLETGEFGAGTMAPKVGACLKFIEAGGRCGIITSLEEMERAIEGNAGTRIVA
jgi:carbamate kinase